MNKLLRIKMDEKKAEFEAVPESMILFGGRGTVAAILTKEVDPACDALGPGNKLIICPGMMADTSAPCPDESPSVGKAP